MLLRRLIGSPSYLCNVHFLKVSCQPRTLTWRGCSISNDAVTSTPHDEEDEDDFFGITEKDLCNKSKTFLPDNPSNEDDLSKETILTKHLSNDVRKNHNDLEKYISTKFGKIRFDWQNTVPSKVREISSPKIKESHRSNDDMDYFSEMYFGHSLGETLANSTTVVSNPSTVEIGDINQKPNNTKDDMNFGNSRENISNYAQNPNFCNPDSVDLEEETFPHDHFQLFDLKKNSNNKVNVTNDNNFIESQYFHNPTNNTQEAESDVNASTKSYKANLPDAVENDLDFTESNFPTNSSHNDNTRFPNSESSQSTEQKDSHLKSQNAYEASQKIRREIKRNDGGPLVDSKGFRILKDQVNDLTHLTTYEIANHLKSRILYNKNDLIVINKPYGLASHGGPGINVNIAKALPELAKKIHHSGEIHLIHRLDKETTGVMLLAKTDKMAHTLNNMFQERQVIKTYWALTKGIPNPSRGVIDIPIAEGSVSGKHRMVLKPEYNEETHVMKKSSVKSHQAITHYRVLCSSFNCALVECKTETGIKHQVRVHLAFGLNTPILGDHKYSHLTKMAPQRLFPEILERLHIRQSKVRHVPMHLHAVSIILPEVIDGQNLIFKAPLPYYFRQNMKSLKFRKS